METDLAQAVADVSRIPVSRLLGNTDFPDDPEGEVYFNWVEDLQAFIRKLTWLRIEFLFNPHIRTREDTQ